MENTVGPLPAPLVRGRLDTSVPVVVIAPGYHGHAIARSLGRLGVPVYGVHADSRSPAARSRYWRENFFWDSEKAAPEDTVNWLLDLAGKIASSAPRPILIPTDDDSCVFVADHAGALKEGFLFPDQPAGLARSLSSKQSMYYLCKKYGIPTPETVFPRCRDDVVEFMKDATFPVMLKGINTVTLLKRTGMRMVVVKDAETLLRRYEEMETPEAPNLMLQEYIPGGSEMIWMFDGYFDAESTCLFGITGKKIRQYPPYSGVTSLGICVANKAVQEQTTTFMKAIGYRGILDLGYKYDAKTDQYKLLDVNPRIGTTFRLFVDTSGMDVARALYLDLTGQPVEVGEHCEGRKWVVENFDLISSPTYCRNDRLSLWKWIRTYRGVQETAWFARDDPAPFLMMGWSSLRWVFRRLFARFRRARTSPSVPEGGKQLVRPGATL
jgi:predicted ATP-grasp superfamily ATP-dependent carboligase